MNPVMDPTAKLERKLFASGARFVAGIDEVGRGAWAGPVSVGIAVVDRRSLRHFPVGVRDSKMLSPMRREQLFEPLRTAVVSYAVGHATPDECDLYGMTKAQHLAAQRAFAELTVEPDAVILDGIIDYSEHGHVVLQPGADRLSMVVAGASVLAKVTRDRIMVDYDQHFAPYCFAKNKGYSSPDHWRALEEFGLTNLHRKSWSFVSRCEP